jgi:hypothetical protein
LSPLLGGDGHFGGEDLRSLQRATELAPRGWTERQHRVGLVFGIADEHADWPGGRF